MHHTALLCIWALSVMLAWLLAATITLTPSLPTLQQVAKYFREIFAELAPGGSGDLVMVKRRREEEGADEEGSDVEGDDGANGARQQAGGMEIMTQYTGVKAKVSRGWVGGKAGGIAG